MINRVVALKNSISIILDIILRLKTKMTKLETRLAAIFARAKLENINALEEKILKMNDRINNQNETFRDATTHANANMIEMFERIKKFENQIERMNWRIVHDEISRITQLDDNEYAVYRHINEIIEWLSRDFQY